MRNIFYHRNIVINDQRDNLTVNALGAYSQCFATSNWMRMSNYTDKIKAGDDQGLAEFLLYMETVVGPKFVSAAHPSLYFNVQSAAVTKWLNDRGVLGKDITDLKFPFEDLVRKLDDGPVTIGTTKIGGLPGGHIILLVDFDVLTDSFVVNDPFGDAKTDYQDHEGGGVHYPVSYLFPFVIDKAGKVRVQYWQEYKVA